MMNQIEGIFWFAQQDCGTPILATRKPRPPFCHMVVDINYARA